jgi:dTDP-glucose 4,6-dehydratase
MRPRTAGRALVTGGAGFLGSWLCERLLDDGGEVVAVDSMLTGGRDCVAHLGDRSGFHLVEADVCEEIPVDGLLDGPFDEVYHLASPASPVHYREHALATLRVGSEGTVRALELAARDGARFLLASTSEVYGDPLQHPQAEDYYGNVNPVGPRSMYDEAKRFAEAVTVAYRDERGVDVCIARIFNSYGPRMGLDDGRVVPTFAKQAMTGTPLTVMGDGSQTRSLCFASDTVDGLVRLARSGHAGPVNIGSDRETTVLELAHLIRDLVGSESPVEHIELSRDDPRLRRPDLTRARSLLGWSPVTPLDEGLPRTLEWLAGRLDRSRHVETEERPAYRTRSA